MAEGAEVYCNEYGWRFEERRNEVDKSFYGPWPWHRKYQGDIIVVRGVHV